MYTLLSYVPDQLFYELRPLIANVSTTRILTKLTAQADANQTAEEIKTLMPAAATLYSVSEQIQLQQSNLMYTGTLNVQRLGVAFAIVAASVGTALVSFVSLKERQREASMMSVRGLSFKQLTIMLLTENLAVVTFAVLLGSIAGLIIVYGNVVSASSTAPSLVAKRLVFPIDTILTIFAYIGLVFASSILPVVIMSRRYISRLERVVRQA
jgi:ABC-type antimicrobial peptide transport system permease subunit